MGLGKYGDNALKEEEQEQARKEREAPVGNDETQYGPAALQGGEHSEEEVRAAAERAGLDPDDFTGAEEAAEAEPEPEFVVLWDRPFEDQAAADLAEQELPGPEALDAVEPTGVADGKPCYASTDVSDAIAALGDEGGEPEEPEEDPDRNMIELAGDRFEFPVGYHAEHVGGGKYRVEDAAGDQVENPDHKKGLYDKDECVHAAWEDFEAKAEEQAQEPEPAADHDLSQVPVDELDEILTAEPELLDERQKAELLREGGPRQEALKILLEHAVEQDRSEIIQVLAAEIDDEDFVAETV